MNKCNKGFTLIGVLAAVGIVAFLLVTVYKYIDKTREDAEAFMFVEDVRAVIFNAIEIRKTDFESHYASRLVSRKMVPAKWVHDKVYVNWFDTPWGRASIAGLGNWFNENPPGFGSLDGVHLFFDRVPTDICYQAVSSLQSIMDYISVNAGRQDDFMVMKWDTEYTRESALESCHSERALNDGWVVLRMAVYK